MMDHLVGKKWSSFWGRKISLQFKSFWPTRALNCPKASQGLCRPSPSSVPKIIGSWSLMIGCCRACLMFVFLNFNKFFLQQTKELIRLLTILWRLKVDILRIIKAWETPVGNALGGIFFLEILSRFFPLKKKRSPK